MALIFNYLVGHFFSSCWYKLMCKASVCQCIHFVHVGLLYVKISFKSMNICQLKMILMCLVENNEHV